MKERMREFAFARKRALFTGGKLERLERDTVITVARDSTYWSHYA